MDSIDLVRTNLSNSGNRTLARIEDMRPHAFLRATPGGPHTLWILGHLAFVEGLVVDHFAFGDDNPLASWDSAFDGDAVADGPADFPSFDVTLERVRGMRTATLVRIDPLTEADLDRTAERAPKGWDATFGTLRQCLQYTSDHWLMHRGQLADARRVAGVDRMWV